MKEKKSSPSRAADLYKSPLFEKSSCVAELDGDDWYILSAKYGLLHKDETIEPYDMTLHDFSREDRRKWAEDVYKNLEQTIESDDSITILAGEVYREHLVPLLEENGYSVTVPMSGKPMGHQLQWLNNQISLLERQQDLDDFYNLLDKLADKSVGPVKMKNADGHLDWPEKGVYFFFEPNEYRDSDLDTHRAVRVGTHGVSAGSSASLWERLRTHRGTESGSGNHRSSIFRLHVGEALMQKEDVSVPTWGTQSPPDKIPESEQRLEQKVSAKIGEMEVLCVEVMGPSGPNSDRAFIEQNAISLLSGYEPPSDTPSDTWLGHSSTRKEIRTSGLWNVNHVDDKYDPRFLEVFERYVNSTIGEEEPPADRISPDKPKDQTTLDRFLNHD